MPKPKFDPSQPFTTPEEAKPKFDPGQPFEVPAEAAPPIPEVAPETTTAPADQDPGILASAGRGALQGATQGWLDKMLGGFAAASAVEPMLVGQVTPEQASQVYRTTEAEQRAQTEAAQAAHPVAFGAGLLGGAALSPNPLGKSSAATALGRIGGSALRGAVAGATTAAGQSQAQELGKFAQDVAKGAAVGGAASGALGTAAEAVRGVATAAPRLRAFAGRQLAKAFGVQSRALVRKIGDAKDVQDLGNWAADEGIVRYGTGLEKAGERAALVVKQSGEAIGALRERIAREGDAPDAKAITGAIDDLVSRYRNYSNPTAKALTEVADAFKADVQANSRDGLVPPEVLDDLKSQLDDVLWNKFADPQGKLSHGAAKIQAGIRDTFRKAEEDVVATLGPGALSTFRKAKLDYGNALDVLRAIGYSEEGQLANLGLGLRETGLVLAGLAHPGGALAAGVAKRLGDRYGNSLAGMTARAAAANVPRLGPLAASFGAAAQSPAPASFAQFMLRGRQ